MGDRIIYKFALRSLNILPVPSVPTIFPRIDESIGSKMVAKSATRSRSITPENSLRSRARTSDRSAKSQVFGPPPPTPSRIYGRKSKARSYMNTPSRLRRPPAASTSNTPSHYSRSLAEQSLALDYEFPVLLPETPSGSSASSSSDLTSIASSSSSSNSSNSNRVKESTLDVDSDSDSDDEPVFISRTMPIQSSAFCEGEIMDKLRQVRLDLENAREVFQTAEENRHKCPCCLEVMLQPFILCCGHTYCKECLIRLADIYLNAKMNLVCPDCRTVQGCFTPIPNYFIQSSLDNMLRMKGIPTPSRQPLQWPLKFQSGPTPLPFPPSAATFPV
ncbi:hypothetical protein C8J55DRAFT_559388 [Lentinula edodes]|uniref:RING-type domain-containing protein n=1 Tax=Lentinula lateritia TaxID=40482 RepID=A0A9W9DSC5_9AGAR|nr:hypothetical protein C8J55DRAFT_559388 [Lentinula edodes]